MKNISVVIPNYNGVGLLRAYLPSVFRAIVQAGVEGEVIIVDDCSTDESVEFIKRDYPQVNLLINEKNLGFGCTCNRGFEMAQHDVVLCLNNDMELRGDFLSQQLHLMEREDVFAVMSRIMSGDGNQVLESCKRLKRDLLGFKIHNIPDENWEGDVAHSLFACGGNALYDRKKLLLLSGYSPLLFPFYMEDVDLSLRAWRMGWKSLYCKSTECYHQHSATIASIHSKHNIDRASYLNYLKMVYLQSDPKMRRRMIAKVALKMFVYAFQAAFSTKKRMRISVFFSFFSFISKANHTFGGEGLSYQFSLHEVLQHLQLHSPVGDAQ